MRERALIRKTVQAFGTISSDIPTHRINDILTALVRAKVAVKVPVPVSLAFPPVDEECTLRPLLSCC